MCTFVTPRRSGRAAWPNKFYDAPNRFDSVVSEILRDGLVRSLSWSIAFGATRQNVEQSHVAEAEGGPFRDQLPEQGTKHSCRISAWPMASTILITSWCHRHLDLLSEAR